MCGWVYYVLSAVPFYYICAYMIDHEFSLMCVCVYKYIGVDDVKKKKPCNLSIFIN